MKSCYTKLLSPVRLAVLDNCDYYGIGRIITRVNVPKEFRGKGVASQLLDECCKDADNEQVILYLEIYPSDGLGYDELEAFYMRRNFKRWRGLYRRRPNTRN